MTFDLLQQSIAQSAEQDTVGGRGQCCGREGRRLDSCPGHHDSKRETGPIYARLGVRDRLRRHHLVGHVVVRRHCLSAQDRKSKMDQAGTIGSRLVRDRADQR